MLFINTKLSIFSRRRTKPDSLCLCEHVSEPSNSNCFGRFSSFPRKLYRFVELAIMGCDKEERKLNQGFMYFDKFGPQLWEICPLNNTHYCKKKEMDDHLAECKEVTLKGPRKVECPYNAMHVVNLMEIEQHIMTCENKVPLFNTLCDLEPKRETVEGVKMEPVNFAMEVRNDWEDGKNPEFGYDAMESTKFRAILRAPPPGMSKRKRKQWHEQERKRHKALVGETREKPKGTLYPTANQIKNAKEASKEIAALKDEADLLSIIEGLGSANIADPRDSMMKQINERLRILRLMESKLKEEKLALQSLVEKYLASIGENDTAKSSDNADPRQRGNRTSNDPRVAGKSNNNDPRTFNHEHSSRIFPDIMTSTMP